MRIVLDTKSKKENKMTLLAALFLYATLVVDLFRKISNHIVTLPFSTSTIRNLIYVLLFIFIFISIKNIKEFIRLGIIILCFICITLISIIVNYQAGILTWYVDLIFMFFSRLLPAFYLGMHLDNSEEFINNVSELQLFSLLYILLILFYPELSADSYMTVSNNLVLVSLLPFFTTRKGLKRVVSWAISIMGLMIIMVYGGRGSLVSVLVSLMLIFLFMNKENTSRRVLVIILFVFAILLVVIFYDQILSLLMIINPKSRTLRLIQKGNFFWTSNRNHYYEAAFESFSKTPLKIYGFLGDRLYYASYFGTIRDLSIVFTMFSHNVLFELLLTLGMPIGIIAFSSFVLYAFIAFIYVYNWGTKSERIVYYVFLGAEIVIMMISSSYLNDYAIWFLVGLIVHFNEKLKNKNSNNDI